MEPRQTILLMDLEVMTLQMEVQEMMSLMVEQGQTLLFIPEHFLITHLHEQQVH